MFRFVLIGTTVAVILCIPFFAVTIFTVRGDSMQPTLQDGNRVWICLLPWEPDVDDIVLLEHPGRDTFIIKRIVGTPLDRMEAGSDYITVGNKKISPIRYTLRTLQLYSRVPPGYYMLLGDNIVASEDSRHFGFVERKRIRGRVLGVK